MVAMQSDFPFVYSHSIPLLHQLIVRSSRSNLMRSQPSHDRFPCSSEAFTALSSASLSSFFSADGGDLGVWLSRCSAMRAPVMSSWIPIKRKNKAPLYCPLGSASENLCAASKSESAEQRNKKVRMRNVSCLSRSNEGMLAGEIRSTRNHRGGQGPTSSLLKNSVSAPRTVAR